MRATPAFIGRANCLLSGGAYCMRHMRRVKQNAINLAQALDSERIIPILDNRPGRFQINSHGP